MPANEQIRIGEGDVELEVKQTEEVHVEGFENLGPLLKGNPPAGGRGLKLRWKGEGDEVVEFEDLGEERIRQIMTLVREHSYVVLEGVERCHGVRLRMSNDPFCSRPDTAIWHQDPNEDSVPNEINIQMVSKGVDGGRAPTAVVHVDTLKSAMAEHMDMLTDRSVYSSDVEYEQMMVYLHHCGFEVGDVFEMILSQETSGISYSAEGSFDRLLRLVGYKLAFLDAVNRTLVEKRWVALNEYSDGVASTILFGYEDDSSEPPFYHCTFYLPESEFSVEWETPVYGSFRYLPQKA